MANKAPKTVPAVPAIAAKANDLEALRSAVVDAAGVSAGFWFSYLFLLFYLLIAVAGVTHRDLLLGNPVTLPVLNVALPLTSFFIVAPGLFIIVHAYILLHFVLLADKVGAFHSELQVQIRDASVRASLRRQLPINIFAQILAGPSEVRTGVIGFMLRLILQFSLVAGPLALLVLIQLQFLPYHDAAITWWHRVAVVIDLVILWILWPPISRGHLSRFRLAPTRRGKTVAMAFFSLIPLLFVFTIGTFPGEPLEKSLPVVRFIPWKADTRDVQNKGLKLYPSLQDLATSIISSQSKQSEGPSGKVWVFTSLHELLVDGAVDYDTRKPKSLWSNRIVLPGFKRTETGKDADGRGSNPTPSVLSLRGRDLSGAVLIGANLKYADFTKAQLKGAALSSADLQGASFDSAELQGVSFGDANLQGATFTTAQLQGAYFANAQMQGTLLLRSQLQAAFFSAANLSGSSFMGAQLQGAFLKDAQLIGATFYGANLQGATLGGATVVAADFRKSYLWRTRISEKGDERTVFENVYMRNRIGNVWTAKIPHSDAKDPNWDSQYEEPASRRVVPWTQESFENLRRLVRNSLSGTQFAIVPQLGLGSLGCRKISITDLLQGGPPSTPSSTSCEVPTPLVASEAAAFKKAIEAAGVDDDSYGQALAIALLDLICGEKVGVEALRGMFRNGQVRTAAWASPTLASRLEAADCPASKALDASQKYSLAMWTEGRGYGIGTFEIP